MKKNTAYRKLQGKLRTMGLPDNYFDVDYEQKLAAAYERHARLLEWIRQKEKEDPEFWCNLPWSPARKKFEEDVANGIVHPFNPLIGQHTKWSRALQLSIWHMDGKDKLWQANYFQTKAKGRRKAKRDLEVAQRAKGIGDEGAKDDD